MRLSSARKGLSLFEVLIALAVFLLALTGLVQLLNIAGSTARDTQYRTYAAHVAQAKMAEVMAGALPMTGSPETAVDEDPNYLYTVEVSGGSAPGLSLVTVNVYRKLPDGSKVATSLTQMVLDPSLTGSTMDVPGQVLGAESTDTSSSSGGGSSTGGTGGTGGTGTGNNSTGQPKNGGTGGRGTGSMTGGTPTGGGRGGSNGGGGMGK
jgi:hypothetical protein